MVAIQLIACIGMVAGAFILLGISPIAFTDGLFGFLTKRSRSIKDDINEATKRKRPFFLRKEIMEVQRILELTGRSNRFSMICASSLLLFAIGDSIAILLENVFLVPVLAIGLMFLPFWYIRLTATHYKNNIAAGLKD